MEEAPVKVKKKTKSKDIIVFTKALDPYKTLEQQHADKEFDFDETNPPTEDRIPTDNRGSFLEEEEEEVLKNSKEVDVLFTPMGVLTLDGRNNMHKLFNFWNADCNFDITGPIVNIIEETAGVETLQVYTRYRFQISIGRCFRFSEVAVNINKRIKDYLRNRRKLK